jgi:hypothetical protein
VPEATTLSAWLAWVQTTRVASTIGQSTGLTALLSGAHLVGMTLVVGGAFLSGLRLLGAFLPERPIAEVAAAPVRGMLAGLFISVSSGLLLFAPRASAAAGNQFFRTKMLLLLCAAAFYFAFYRRASRAASLGSAGAKLTGACGLLLWFGVALAGCAFILLE